MASGISSDPLALKLGPLNSRIFGTQLPLAWCDLRSNLEVAVTMNLVSLLENRHAAYGIIEYLDAASLSNLGAISIRACDMVWGDARVWKAVARSHFHGKIEESAPLVPGLCPY